jgi:hypothetical protein
MSRKYLTNIDLNTNELQNAVVQNLSSAPNSGNKEGRIYYDSVTHKLRYYGADNAWYDLAAGGTAASTVTLTGDVTGTGNVNPSTGIITITTTIQPNSIVLGTDTTGDYVAGINGTANQISVSGSGGEDSTPTIALTDDVKIVTSLDVADGNFTVNSAGRIYTANELEVTGAATLNNGLTINNAMLQVNSDADITGDVEIHGTLTIDTNLQLSGIEFVGNSNNSIYQDGNNLVIAAGAGDVVINPDGQLVVNADMSAYAVHTQTVTNTNGALNVQSSDSVDISAPAVSITGVLTVNNDTEFIGNVTVDGDLEVLGTLIAVNKETLDVADNKITLNSNWTGAPTQDAAIIVNRGTANDTALLWSESNDQWQLTNDGTNYHAIARKSVFVIGDDVTSSFTLTHNLNTYDVTIQVFENNPQRELVETDVRIDDDNSIIVGFTEAPSTNAYRVVVVG